MDYYTSDLYFLMDNEASAEDLEHELHRILKLAHNYNEDGPDTLSSNCQKGRCYKHLKHSYKEARKYMFGFIHLQEDDDGYYVTDVYCQEKFSSKNMSSYPPGPFSIPNHKYINAEHTWPQSWFGNRDKSLKKADLHSLFPSNSRANSNRSNNPFGNVTRNESHVCSASKSGYSSDLGETAYEPPNAHKGNVARAMFYFAVRYSMDINDKQEKILREWDQLDPIDDAEKLRNQQVFDFQNTRNPFIDFPELASTITDF